VFSATGSIGTTTSLSADTTPDTLDKIDSIQAYNDYAFGGNENLLIGAQGPGVDGQNIAVGIEWFSSACDWKFSFDDYTTSAVSATSYPNASKVFKLNVYTKSNKETWTTDSLIAFSAYNPVETFYGTIRQQTDSDGNTLQIEEIVNGKSQFVYVKVPTAQTEFTLTSTPVISVDGVLHNFNFKGLQSGVTAGENAGLTSTAGYDLLTSKEAVDVDIIIVPTSNTAVKKKAADVAAIRQDCIAVCQAGARTDTTVTQIAAAEAYGYTNPSYVALYATWPLVYDQYNDRKVYLPLCIYGAAAMARTDAVANVWDAPAGYARGIVGPALDMNVILSNGQVGQLYDLNINSTLKVPGVGFVIWGQKTAQLKHSSLDRINVRRLVTFLETSIQQSLQQYVLDITNTDKNRLRVWSNVDGFVSTVQSAGGLVGHLTTCDSTNNTPDVIDNNQLVVTISVQPVHVAEFLILNVVVTRTGVNVTTA
jgi:hypothetical protein